jgi:hypothetical protein
MRAGIFELAVSDGKVVALDYIVNADRGALVLGDGEADGIGTIGGDAVTISACIAQVAHGREPVVIRLPWLLAVGAAYAGPYIS